MSMVEVKVEELSGAALDWAVAQAEGLDWQLERGCYGSGHRVVVLLPEPAHKRYGVFRPSTDWSQGGPLIEKYKVCIGFEQGDEVYAVYSVTGMNGQSGGTPLIAACRAIVAAKLGPAVSVPAELVTA